MPDFSGRVVVSTRWSCGAHLKRNVADLRQYQRVISKPKNRTCANLLTGARTHKHARAKHTKTRDRPQLHTKRVSIYLIVSGSLFVVAVVDIVLLRYSPGQHRQQQH